MFKAYKASDQQWIEWIQKADQKEEKIWAIRFFGFAGLALLVSLVGLIFGRIEFIGAAMGALLFFLMGAAKLNNYRLYGIIQSLAAETGRPVKQSREPVDADNPVNPPKNSKNQLDD